MPDPDIQSLQTEIEALCETQLINKNQITKLRAQSRNNDFQLKKIKRDGNTEKIIEKEERRNLLNVSFIDSKEIIVHSKELIFNKLQTLTTTPPDQLINLYCSDQIPFLMFPVRLETKLKKLDDGTKQLWIRIFPDDIHVHTHEPYITEEELEDITQYREDSQVVDEVKQKQAWKELVDNYGANRASWLKKINPNGKKSDGTAPVDGDDLTDLFYDVEYPFDDTSDPIPELVRRVRLRPESWSEAPKTYLMPDQFVIRLYPKSGTPRQVRGNPIPYPLIVSPDPMPLEVDSAEPDVDYNETLVDADSSWLTDMEKSVEMGMALKIRISNEEYEQGFEKIIALGIKLSISAESSRRHLFRLIENHRYTQGFSLVPQGTPTNNTTTEKSGDVDNDDDSESSYDLENQPFFESSLIENSDGKRFANYLGLPIELFHNVENINNTDYLDAHHINKSLWPATLGYYITQLITPNNFLSDPHVRQNLYAFVEKHFNDFVIGRGPLSAFKVGNMPYSFLPITKFSDWEPNLFDSQHLPEVDRNHDLSANQFISSLNQKLFPKWKEMANNPEKIPKIGTSLDSDEEIIQILGMNASSTSFLTRHIVNEYYLWHLSHFLLHNNPSRLREIFEQVFGISFPSHNLFDPNRRETDFWTIVNQLKAETRQQIQTFLGTTQYYNAPILSTIAWNGGSNLNKPLIYEDTEEYSDDLLEYINTVRELPYEELQNHSVAHSGNLFFDLLRRSILTKEYLNRDLFNPVGNPKRPWIDASLSHLWESGKKNPKRLKMALTEHLDLSANRVDAFLVSSCTKRFFNMDKTGIFIGAYGILEDLHKEDQNPSAGSIHCLSNNHAITAAMLRSAHYNNSDSEAKETLSINLSSARTRKALRIMEGTRQGLSLSLQLGKQFEIGLHENYRTQNLELDEYVHAFRELYPIDKEDRENESENELVDSVIARNVVDGLQLLEAWKKFNENNSDGIPFGTEIDVYDNSVFGGSIRLPIRGRDHEAIVKELKALDDTFDAVKDVGLSESVFQTLNKNYEGANAVMDGLSGKNALPEPMVTKTPRHNTTIQQKFMILFSGEAREPLRDRYSSTRSYAEPHLNKWANSIFINPNKIHIRTWYDSASELFLEKDNGKVKVDIGQDNGKLNIDLNSVDNQKFKVLLSKNSLSEIINPPTGSNSSFTLQIIQDDIGEHTLNFEDKVSSVPIINSDPNSITKIEFSTTDAGTTYTAAISNIDTIVNDEFTLETFLKSTESENEQGFTPLDFLYMCNRGLDESNSEIKRRIDYYVKKLHNLPFDKQISIINERKSTWNNDDQSISDTLSMGQKLFNIVAKGKFLYPHNLLINDETELSEDFLVDVFMRLETTKAGLRSLFRQLMDETNGIIPELLAMYDATSYPEPRFTELVTELRTKLFKLGNFAIDFSIPLSAVDTDKQIIKLHLIEKAKSACLEVMVRLTKCQKIINEEDLTNYVSNNGTKVPHAVKAIQKLLGESFTIIPRFKPSNLDEIHLSLNNLKSAHTSHIISQDEKISWFHKTSQTKKQLEKFEDFEFYQNALYSTNKSSYHIFQIPYVDNSDTWVGNGLVNNEEKLESERRSFVSIYPQASSINESHENIGALVIDSWNESIPSEIQQTSVAFNFDAPNSQPSHVPLLVVPPKISTGSGKWRWDYLVGALEDTLELAKIRLVDIDSYQEVGKLLPALYLPTHLTQNFRGDM